MLSEKMAGALNDQINAEFYSSYIYLSMSSYFQSISLAGFASWMKMQTQEEIFHAMKLFHFVNERGGRVILKAIDAPQTAWQSPLDVFKHVLAHEQKVTALINNLVNIAQDERDHATNIFLQWFVSEQVEEEANVGSVLEKLKLIGSETSNLFILDQDLGSRVFTPPAA